MLLILALNATFCLVVFGAIFGGLLWAVWTERPESEPDVPRRPAPRDRTRSAVSSAEMRVAARSR